MNGIESLDINSVRTSYKRWAPVYDKTFGVITMIGRRKAVEYINRRQGKVLEIGVGTGLSLKQYRRDLEVTGIDVSGEMLEKARAKVVRRGLTNVAGLHEMDARTLDFPDDHFDIVVAMYLVSVVPEPERVVAEMARVCKPGGEVLIVNHFARDRGPLSLAEKALAPFANEIGWHSDFSIHQVLNHDALTMVEQKPLPPLGMFTFLRMEKAS